MNIQEATQQALRMGACMHRLSWLSDGKFTHSLFPTNSRSAILWFFCDEPKEITTNYSLNADDLLADDWCVDVGIFHAAKGVLTEAEYEQLRKSGAAGSICFMRGFPGWERFLAKVKETM